MAIPVLKLNLVPPPSFWRRYHELLGWGVLCAGAISLALVTGLVWRAYRQANDLGKQAEKLAKETQGLVKTQNDLLNKLRTIDVAQEMPRWKLAERILSEQSLPWSRLAAELERCLAHESRLKSIQRTRDTAGSVLLKLKGEAKSRESEAAFLEAALKNKTFSQVVLERESERQGGGWEFECTFTASQEPPTYELLPKYAKPIAQQSDAPKQVAPTKHQPVRVAPVKAPIQAPKKAPAFAPQPMRAPSPPAPDIRRNATEQPGDRFVRRPMPERRPPPERRPQQERNPQPETTSSEEPQ